MNDLEIFEKAIAISDEGERDAYLAEACAGDEGLRSGVDALLESARDAGSFMERQAAESLQATIATETLGDPQTVGPYKVLEKIGEGGFGVVYMAEQLQPIQRRVALKVIKAGMDTKQVVARFESERQALAIMDHPNIGKILDAGATDSGRPYFVMELVRGIPITDYCAERKLSTQERLELFKEVCRAIEHAHQKGIIHRDIKPSNVLVYNNGERAVPKVIDFGIAKATQGRLTAKTLFTQFHQFIGTPAYMSPEQAQMSGVDVDTRSDIYSLGVLLYELLTGKTPLDPKGLNKQAYQEACRRIREDEAPVPSKRVSTLTHDERSALADSQQTTPSNVSARLRGDLDWIVMKALEKDRSRRYKSTDAFVTDIVRHLNNEPVSAGPPNVAYLFQKFVRRNRTSVLTTTGVATLLLLGTIATTTLWLRADDAANQLSLQVQETADALGRAEKETARATKAESVARHATERAEDERDRSIEIAYQADMYVAHQALLPQSFNLGLARRILERTRRFTSTQDPRHWEWRALWLQCQGDAERHLRIGPGWGLVEPIPNTTKFVAAGQNNGVSVWDYSRGKQLQTLIEPVWNIFRISCSVDGKKIYIGDKYGKIRIWSWDGKRFEATADMDHGTQIVDMAVSGDGKWLVTLGKVTRGRFPAQAKVWDLATGKLRKTLPEGKAGGEGRIAISKDSSKLLVGLADEVRIIELDTLEEERSIPQSGWHSLAVSPDNESLAFTAQESGFRVHRTNGEFVGRVEWDTDTRASWLVYSPDAKTIAACDDQIVRLYDTATLREIRTLRGHDAFINCVAFSHDGKTLLSSDHDGKVGVWNVDQHPAEWPESREQLSLTKLWFRQHSQVSFSFDGSKVASTLGGWNDESRHVAILSSDDLVAKQTVCQTEVYKRGVRFSPVAELLAVGDWEGSLAFVNTAESPAVINKVSVPGGGMVFPCRFSRDGTRLLVVAGERNDSWHHVYSVADRKPIYSWRMPEEDTCSTISAPGKLVATGHPDGVRVWSLPDTENPVFFPLQNLYSVDISPDETTLVASRVGSRLEVYDLTTQKHLGSLEGSGAVRFSHDGRRLASGDRTGLALWDVRTMRQILSQPSPHSCMQLEWSPDDNSIMMMSRWGSVSIWHVPCFEEIQRRESR